MTIKWLLPIIFFIFTLNLRADVPVKIRRICKNGKDNYIYFYPSSDPCALYFQYKIWGRNGLVGPYSLIDSVTVKNTSLYIHSNANPGIATNWSYFIVITDSCGPDYETSSDTISVDEQAPVSTFIDSVSVDPITNKVQIGWHSNPSPDFSYYIVYKDSLGNNLVVSSNSKDTFMIDTKLSSNPTLRPIKYDISAVDSCENAKIFGLKPQTTIWLRQKEDTCERKTTLTWSPYIGWNQVRIYYIYRKTNSGQYILVDSVPSSQTSYTDTITLGFSYSYYIRGFKDTSIVVSSSSNSSSFITRFRVEPTSSYISSVSVLDPPGISIHIFNPFQEVRKYDIFTSRDMNGFYSFVSSINGIPGASNYQTLISLNPENKYIQATAYNGCGEPFLSTDTSRYIQLKALNQNQSNVLSWETYFTWNVGVNYYRIYRGTDNNLGDIIYALIDSVPGFDTTYIDTSLPPIVGENGLCYYVVAIQNSGDVNGSIEAAASTRSCIVGDLKVFIPNAFRPTGIINTTFRPEGSYIDYTNSSLEIYDRWGGRIISIENIRNGWDGKDSSGVLCMQGVYCYKIFIKSTNGKEKVFTGLVTLLD